MTISLWSKAGSWREQGRFSLDVCAWKLTFVFALGRVFSLFLLVSGAGKTTNSQVQRLSDELQQINHKRDCKRHFSQRYDDNRYDDNRYDDNRYDDNREARNLIPLMYG